MFSSLQRTRLIAIRTLSGGAQEEVLIPIFFIICQAYWQDRGRLAKVHGTEKTRCSGCSGGKALYPSDCCLVQDSDTNVTLG